MVILVMNSLYPLADCNRTINADNGTISSPRYPSNYYSKANCHWHITTRPGTYVLLQFKDFLMEGLVGGVGTDYDPFRML